MILARRFDFPEADPNLSFSQRGEEVLVMNSAGSVVPLNALQVAVLHKLDGHTEVADVARSCSDEFEQDIPLEAIEEFVRDARNLGLLSLRYAGPADDHLAERRCRGLRRKLRSLGLPPPHENPLVQEMSQRLMDRLMNKDPRGAISSAYALREIVPNAEWTQRIVLEVETLAKPSVIDGQANMFVIPLWNPMRALGIMERFLGWAFTYKGLILWTAYIAVGLSCDLTLPPISALMDPTALIAGYAAGTVGMALHEISHAFTCFHYGGRVSEIGVGLMMGTPFAYADVTSSYLFDQRWKRMLVMIAGLMGTLFYIATVGILCSFLPPESSVRAGLLYSVGAAWVFDIGFNLIPLMKLDGYYLLAEWLGIDNLRQRAFDFLRGSLAHFVAGDAVPPPEVTDRERTIYWTYAVTSALFIVGLAAFLIQYSYVELVGQWRGYGLLALVVASVAMVAPGLISAVRHAVPFVQTNQKIILERSKKPMVRGVLAGIFVLLFLIWLPESADATFELRPSVRADVRARVPGQVSLIHVQPGQRVQKGDLLASLVSWDLQRAKANAEAARQQAWIELEKLANGARKEEERLARSETSSARTGREAALRRALQLSRSREAGLATAEEAREAQAEYAFAFSAARKAEAEQELVEAGSRKEDLAAAEARVRGTEAAVAAADREIEELQLRSPVDGLVLESELDSLLGRFLSRGDKLLSIQSDETFVAELVPRWVPNSSAMVNQEVKLMLATGTVMWSTVKRVSWKAGADEVLRFESYPIASPGLKAGLTGRARMYGPRVPIFVEYVWHPIWRFFVSELWASL